MGKRVAVKKHTVRWFKREQKRAEARHKELRELEAVETQMVHGLRKYLPHLPIYANRIRASSIEHYELDHEIVFTCDSCPNAQQVTEVGGVMGPGGWRIPGQLYCVYAFDAYNTDGDCLAEK